MLADRIALSKSQPDLSKAGMSKLGGDLLKFRRGVSVPRPKTRGREESESAKGYEFGPSIEMIEILIKENSALKAEFESCYQKVAKSQKVHLHLKYFHN